ncbi:MAG: hypothetical protein ABI363_06185 [Nitrosospira sp.]
MASGSGGAVPQRLDEFFAFGGVVDGGELLARTSVRRLLEASRTRRRSVLARLWEAA